MMQAGYHPEGMLGVMEVLAEAARGSKQPEFLSSHPHPDTRIETIKNFLAQNRDEIARLNLTHGRRLR
jgi:predicted Zn-dependent protease